MKDSQCKQILDILAIRPRANWELAEYSLQYNARIFDLKDNGCYPERIIIPTKNLKILLEEIEIEERFFGKSELCKFPKLVYKGIIIENDKKIKDWILIAPEHN